MEEFLTKGPITPKEEDMEDIARRKQVDEKRMEEQKQFYEIARKRAAELDVYMEQYVCRRLRRRCRGVTQANHLAGSDRTS